MDAKASAVNGARMTIWDEAYFESLDYDSQWDELVRSTLTEGTRSALPLMALHLTWDAIQCSIILCLTLLFEGDSSDFGFSLAKNLILCCFVSAKLGVNGMYQGPLVGEPSLRFSARWFTVGSVKEPLLARFGKRRTKADVILNVVSIIVAAYFVASPSMPLAAIHAFLVFLQYVTDYGAFIGADGMYHGPLALLLYQHYVGGGAMAAMQLWLALLYVGCGVGKMGPWFAYVFSVEWTTPPWAVGRSWLRRLFFGDHDYTPTRTARAFAAAAACAEFFSAPLLFFPATARVGVSLLVSMHIYIVAHLPCIDVTMLNVLPAYLLVYSTWPGGFDRDDWRAAPAWLKLFLLSLASVACFGQRVPRKLSCVFAYRFWAGNWCQGFYFVSPRGLEELRHAQIAPGGPSLDDLVIRRRIHPWQAKVLCLQNLASMWLGQLCARILPDIIRHLRSDLAPPKLTQFAYVFHCMAINQWVIGNCSNCALRSKPVFDALCEACHFGPGEFVLVTIDSFPLFGSTAAWQVHDASNPACPIASGTTTTAHCKSVRHPSFSSTHSKTKGS